MTDSGFVGAFERGGTRLVQIVGVKKALPTLIMGLKGNGRELRWAMASVLGSIGKDAAPAAPALLALLSDPDREVRLRAVWALRRIGLPTIIRCIKEDSDPSTRLRAADEVFDSFPDESVPRGLVQAVRAVLSPCTESDAELTQVLLRLFEEAEDRGQDSVS